MTLRNNRFDVPYLPDGVWGLFMRKRLYIRFDEYEVHAICLGSDRSCRVRSLIALRIEGTRRRVQAIGDDVLLACASKNDVVVLNPFGHERVVVDDVEVAAGILRYIMARLCGGITLRPYIILHPKRHFPCGLTPIEKQGLHDLAEIAGAEGTAVHEGNDLSPEEIATYNMTPRRT